MDVLRKKWLKVLFMMSFALALFLPAKAVKAANYNVWVNGVQFTDTMPSFACGTGTAAYDDASKTLTLTNATVTQFHNKSLIYSEEAVLNIVLKGTNVLDGSADTSNMDYGIRLTGKGNISGETGSKLTMKQTSEGIYSGDFMVYPNPPEADLTIKNADIEIKECLTNGNAGIMVYNGALTVESSVLNISVTGSGQRGIHVMSEKPAEFKDSTITVSSVYHGIVVGDSEAQNGSLLFHHCTVKLAVAEPNPGDAVDEQYGVQLFPFYGAASTPQSNDKTMSITGGGSFEVDAKTGVTNQATASKITLPKDSNFYQSGNAADGWGNQIVGSRKVKITIGTGTALIDGSGKDAGSSGGNSGGESGGGGSTGESGGSNGGSSTGENGTGNGNGTGDGSGNGSGNGSSSAERMAQKGEDGTFLGKGASVEAAESFLADFGLETDPAGASFGILCARSTKTTKNSVKVTWKKVSGASKYIIYASNCGKGNKVKQVSETTKTSYILKKFDGKKIKKGTYYKFIVMAVDGNNDVIATSVMIHSATLGGKVGNCKAITTNAKKNKVSLKVKKTFKLKVKQTPQKKGLKINKHRADKYESSDPKIATVSKKGVIKGVAAGKCSVYVYAQNGVYKEIKVTVK